MVAKEANTCYTLYMDNYKHTVETKELLSKLAKERSTSETVNRILQSDGYKQRIEKYKWKQILNQYPDGQMIVDLYNSKQMKELSVLWGCSVDCVRTVRDKLGLQKKNISQIELTQKYTKEQLEDLYFNKYDRHLKGMAEGLNVYQDTLAQVFETLGIIQQPHHPSEYSYVREMISDKAKERMLDEEYKANIRAKITKHVYLPTNEYLVDFCKRYGAPEATIRHIAEEEGINKAYEYVVKNLDETGKYKQFISALEIKFIDLFNGTNIKVERWCKNVDSIQEDVRPDVQLTYGNKVIYVDVHGLYYHCSTMQLDRNYHFDRRILFEDAGIRYIQFYEDEIKNQPEIVKSIILNTFGLTNNKYFARKLDLKLVPNLEAVKFFQANHLMGPHRTSKSIGLYNGDELICCLSYRCSFNKGKTEIARFATKLNTSCVGGFGKLVSYLKQFNKPIVSYCDLRYATGRSYIALGFKELGTTLGWEWTNLTQRFNRTKCKAGNGKTEKQNATELGWYRIYDAGQRKYEIEAYINEQKTKI